MNFYDADLAFIPKSKYEWDSRSGRQVAALNVFRHVKT